MKRRLEAELLDHLAADDPAAIASRRDLERINLAMRAPAIMAAALARLRQPRRLIDLGGGDGRFLLRVARQLPEWRGVTALVADRQALLADRTRADFAALGWRCEIAQGDIFDTLNAMDGALVTANLFLHHLDDAALEEAFVTAILRPASVAGSSYDAVSQAFATTVHAILEREKQPQPALAELAAALRRLGPGSPRRGS